MLRSFIFALLLLLTCRSAAQVINGIVIDEEDKSAIASVSVQNKKTGYVALTDAMGHFSIAAQPGEVLTFSHLSYGPFSRKVVQTDFGGSMTINLTSVDHRLQQVIVSGKTKYQQDSTERHVLFDHELNRPLVPKPKYLGLGCAGCFGWLADKITGNSKKSKHFRNRFAADDELSFIDSRYNPDIVGILTGLEDRDSIAAFMFRYPMDYQFARAATELEIKAWVRYNYREYKATLPGTVNGVK